MKDILSNCLTADKSTFEIITSCSSTSDDISFYQLTRGTDQIPNRFFMNILDHANNNSSLLRSSEVVTS